MLSFLRGSKVAGRLARASKSFSAFAEPPDKRASKSFSAFAEPPDVLSYEKAAVYPNLIGKAVHLLQCKDQLGVLARVAHCVASRGANILNVDLHISTDGTTAVPTYYARSEFAFDPKAWKHEEMQHDFACIAEQLRADVSVLKVAGKDKAPRTAILASSQDHCLVDLLYKWQEEELPVDIACVISNHDRSMGTHVRRFLQRHAIPYYYIPTNAPKEMEHAILNLVAQNTDFLILARFMRILSANFLTTYGKDIINIHHGLLPSFKGANPYRQAYTSGVKLIGATSHFVTEELDNGPIIEQMVERVSHRDTIEVFRAKSENLEKLCLASAVKNYAESRIVRYGDGKTIVFS